MLKTGRNYVYGSAAEKFSDEEHMTPAEDFDVYEKNRVLKSKRAAKKAKKLQLKQILLVLFAFSTCFLVLYRYTLITEMGYRELEYAQKYEKLKSNNMLARIEIDKSMDLNRIEEIAKNNLDMQRPDQRQIVYVKVPRNDHTEVAGKQAGPKHEAGMATALMEKVNSFISYIY